MITAIIDRLKTGSIQNVIPLGDNVANPEKPYVVVWKGDPTQQAGAGENGNDNYSVNAHFPPGHVNQLEDYIETETWQLLNDKILTTRDGRKLKLESTSRIGKTFQGNDDKTISKLREFTTPGIYE